MPHPGQRLRRLLFSERDPCHRVSRTAISRRAFVRAGGAGIITTLSATRPTVASSKSAGIVGGGLAGLAAASVLADAGVDVTVYEARRRPGGRVFSANAPFAPDLVLDLGGAFVNSDHADMTSLIDSLGLTVFDRRSVEDPTLPTEAYFFDGRWLDEPALSAALRPLADAIDADAALLDEDWDANLERLDRQSVADYVHGVVGTGGTLPIAAVIDRAIRSEYGVDAASASAMELIWLAPQVDGERVALLGAADEAYTVVGGAGQVPVRMAERLGSAVRYGAIVTEVVDEGAAGVRVRLASGDDARHDAVIVTTPFPAVRTMTVEGSLPPEFVTMVAEARLGRNEKLFAGFDGRPWRREGGFSREVWNDLGFCTVWDATERQSDATSAALIFFHGGAEVDPLLDGSAAAQAAHAVGRLSAAVDGLADRQLPGALRTGWTRDPLAGGSYTSFAPGFYSEYADFLWYEYEDGSADGPLFGNLCFAGEHLSDAYYGYMNGAVETSRLAATAILTHVLN
ncbi:MAG: NAD(P)/FAD-dependent oxidoreductase [Pseudomonadota bacterium]